MAKATRAAILNRDPELMYQTEHTLLPAAPHSVPVGIDTALDTPEQYTEVTTASIKIPKRPQGNSRAQVQNYPRGLTACRPSLKSR